MQIDQLSFDIDEDSKNAKQTQINELSKSLEKQKNENTRMK